MPEPNVQGAYTRALFRARMRGLVFNQQGQERILAAMEDVLLALTKDVQEGRITAARASSLKEQVRRLVAEFSTRFATAADQSVRLTASEVAGIHRAVNIELFRRVELVDRLDSVGRSFDLVPTRAVAAVLARDLKSETFQTVARRQLRMVVPQIDRFIEASVARGVSAGRATYDLASLLANGNETLLARVPRGVSGRLHRGVGQIDFSAYGLSPGECDEVRSLLYDSRRIQVSEVNNTLRETNARSMVVSPVVRAATWQVSGRHHHSDSCDVLAQADLYGLGPGVHPADRWPVGPHPFCGCMQGGPVVYRPIREWNQPKPASNPMRISPTDSSLYEKWTESWTPSETRRHQAAVSRSIPRKPM